MDFRLVLFLCRGFLGHGFGGDSRDSINEKVSSVGGFAAGRFGAATSRKGAIGEVVSVD